MPTCFTIAPSGPAEWSGQPLGEDLTAQLQALGADPGAVGRGQTGHLVTALAAEAALLGHGLRGDRRDGGAGGPGRLAGGDRLAGHRDAAIADVDAGARDERLHLLGGAPAERAGPGAGPFGGLAPGPAAAGALHDLVYALVAEAERGGDLAERRAGQVQAADGPVEFRPRALGGALGLDEIRLGDLRLVQKVRI